MNEELSSTATSLRNTFMNKIAGPEDIQRACGVLAEKLALIDLLDEALHGNRVKIVSTQV
jgi:hypothetical protein